MRSRARSNGRRRRYIRTRARARWCGSARLPPACVTASCSASGASRCGGERRLSMNSALERARAVAVAARDAGGRALIVGGWVRDRLMGREAQPDIDVEVFGLPSERVRRLLESFGRVEAVG